MKKYLKNTLMIFLIIFFILSIANLIFQTIQYYFVTTPQIIEFAESIQNNGISGEDSYQIIASVYAAGHANKIKNQIIILLISSLLSIVISFISAKRNMKK